MTEPNAFEKTIKSTGEFVDDNITGKLSGATDAVAKGASGVLDENTTKGIMPWLAGGLATIAGMLLLEPINWAVKGAFKLLRNVVTLGGLLEDIPVIGGLFKALGDAIDTVGEYAGYVVPAIAGFIGYKAFQTTPTAVPPTVGQRVIDGAKAAYEGTGKAAGTAVDVVKNIGETLRENADEIVPLGAVTGSAALVGARANALAVDKNAALQPSEQATARLMERLEKRFGADNTNKLAEKMGFDKSPLSEKEAALVEETVVKRSIAFERQKEAEALSKLRPGMLSRIGNALKPVGKIFSPIVEPFAPLVTIPYRAVAAPFKMVGGMWNLGANAAYKLTGGRLGHNDLVEAARSSITTDNKLDAAKEILRKPFTIDDAVADSIKEEFTAQRAGKNAAPNPPATEAKPPSTAAKAPTASSASQASGSPGANAPTRSDPLVIDGYEFVQTESGDIISRPARPNTTQPAPSETSGRVGVMDAPEAPAPRTTATTGRNTMSAAENIAAQLEVSQPATEGVRAKAPQAFEPLEAAPATSNKSAYNPLTARSGFIKAGSATGVGSGYLVVTDENADTLDKMGGWALIAGGSAAFIKPQMAGPLAAPVALLSAPLTVKSVGSQVSNALDSNKDALDRLESARQAATLSSFAVGTPLLLTGAKQVVGKVIAPVAIVDGAVNLGKLGHATYGANKALGGLDQALKTEVDTKNFSHLLVLGSQNYYLATNSTAMSPYMEKAIRGKDGNIDLQNPANIPVLRAAITAGIEDNTNKLDAYESIGPRMLWSSDRIKYYHDAVGERNNLQAALTELAALEGELKNKGQTVPTRSLKLQSVDILASNKTPDLNNYATLKHIADIEPYLPATNGSIHYHIGKISRDSSGKLDVMNPQNIANMGKLVVALEKEAKARADVIDGTWLNDNETRYYNAANSEATMYKNAFEELKHLNGKLMAEEAQRKAAETEALKPKLAEDLRRTLEEYMKDMPQGANSSEISHSSSQPIPTNNPELGKGKGPQKNG